MGKEKKSKEIGKWNEMIQIWNEMKYDCKDTPGRSESSLLLLCCSIVSIDSHWTGVPTLTVTVECSGVLPALFSQSVSQSSGRLIEPESTSKSVTG